MILLKELKLNNWLSHENTTISFEKNERLLVDGKSGSGKSSITEAVLFALYGKGRSENRSLIRKGTKLATVSLKLADGERETLITRSVTDKGKNSIAVTQNTGSEGQFLPIERTGLKDIQEWIEKEFIKASYELFTNSIAYPQENENSFVKANASKRKDLLLEIVRAGNFDELYEKTRSTLNKIEVDTAVANSQIEKLKETSKKLEEVAKKYDGYKFGHDNTVERIEAGKKIEKELEQQNSLLRTLSKTISDKSTIRTMLNKNLVSIETQIDKELRSIKEYDNVDLVLHTNNVKLHDSLLNEITEIESVIRKNSSAQQQINAHLSNRPSLFDYSNEIDEINKRLISLVKETGTCPSGDKCPFLAPVRGQIDFLTSQIEDKSSKSLAEKVLFEAWEEAGKLLPAVEDTTELYKQLEDKKNKILELSKSKEIILRHISLKDSIDGMRTNIIKLTIEKDNIIVDIKSKDEEILELEKQLTSAGVNEYNLKLSQVRIQLQEEEKIRQTALVNMQGAINAQEELKVSSVAIVEALEGISRALSDKESLELLKEALSPRGVKAVVVDYIVPQLEEKINNVLGKMSDFKIRLDTQKSTADDEGVKEGLFITVLNDRMEELPFDSYSGGEKIKITISISEALASLVSNVGFRIMDENIVSLDKESTEGFVIVLEKLQGKFNQLIVVSHLQEVKDIFENKITVIKTNGISKII